MGNVFLKLGLGFVFLTVFVVVIGRSVEKRSVKRMLNKMAATFGMASVMSLVVLPWFLGRMDEVTKRPLTRMQQQQEAQRLEIERKVQAERELMGNVHKLVKESKEEIAAKPLPGVIVEASYREKAFLDEEDRQVRFEDAWRRWYKKSAECAGGNSVECGNDFVRKRREFQQLYAAGKVR